MGLPSVYVGDADRNVELIQIQRSNYEKTSKNCACICLKAKIAAFINSCVNIAVETELQDVG